MPFTYSRKEILSGVGFNTIVDSKFKANTVSVKFITKLSTDTVATNSLAVSMLGSANATYRTIPEFSQRLNELYGSSIGSDISKVGDVQVLTVSARSIDDKFAFDGENLTELVTDMLLDCIFNPVVSNGAFNEELFNISKKELLDTIESEVNNKRTYAIIQSKKTIYRGEPASILSYGDREHTLKATPTECYNQYLNLLRTSNVEIFYVGSVEKPTIESRFTQAFSKLDRHVEEFPSSKASVIKSQVEEVSESIDVNQAKTVLALKTTHTNKYDNAVMNTILGMSPFSKLFTNVREKLSLCYYCQSSYDNQKKTIFIDSGVEVANLEKSKEAILLQVKGIQEGDFTDEELENAIKYLCNSLKSVGDTQSSYVSWYLSNVLINDLNRTVDSEYHQYLAVTRQGVIDSAKALTLDTIYTLTNNNE